MAVHTPTEVDPGFQHFCKRIADDDELFLALTNARQRSAVLMLADAGALPSEEDEPLLAEALQQAVHIATRILNDRFTNGARGQ